MDEARNPSPSPDEKMAPSRGRLLFCFGIRFEPVGSIIRLERIRTAEAHGKGSKKNLIPFLPFSYGGLSSEGGDSKLARFGLENFAID